MKSNFVFLFVFVFSSFATNIIPEGKDNQLSGKIIFKDCTSTFVKGTGYNKDGTEIMHSNDPMGKPEMNVIVSLHPLDFHVELVPTKEAYITQKEQTFLPNVLPVVLGSKVHFLNEDEFFHNVQSYTPQSRFSIGRRAPGISYSKKIDKLGAIKLVCDIHTQMNATILSLDTPYFTRVKADGTFTLTDLPDGRYRVEVFHPNCSKIVDELTLSGGAKRVVTYDFTAKP